MVDGWFEKGEAYSVDPEEGDAGDEACDLQVNLVVGCETENIVLDWNVWQEKGRETARQEEDVCCDKGNEPNEVSLCHCFE